MVAGVGSRLFGEDAAAEWGKRFSFDAGKIKKTGEQLEAFGGLAPIERVPLRMAMLVANNQGFAAQ